jgi:hypothetical protein
MKQSKNKVMAAAPHVVFADTQKPKSIREFFKPKFSFALLEMSYPLLLVGSCGSGRTAAICSLLAQNIRDEMPFVSINGQGDTSVYATMFAHAENNNRTDDLYLINFMCTEPGLSHTFDPINPLIGDEESFLAIYGPAFGKALHALCLCEHASGALVDIERLKSFLAVEQLETILSDDKYAPAKQPVEAYVKSIRALEYGSGETLVNKEAVRQHEKNIESANLLIDLMEKYPVASTTPDIDFDQLFKHRKFLLIALPALEKDPDVLGILNTLFACLLSRATEQFPRASAHPAVVFDASFDLQVLSPAVLSRFSYTNTVFAYADFPSEGRPRYLTFKSITQMAGAVINMRSEATIPDSIRVSAWEHRVDRKVRDGSFCSLRPGHSIAWGAIGVLRKKVMRTLIGDAGFVFRRVDAASTEFITLSKKPVDM